MRRSLAVLALLAAILIGAHARTPAHGRLTAQPDRAHASSSLAPRETPPDVPKFVASAAVAGGVTIKDCLASDARALSAPFAVSPIAGVPSPPSPDITPQIRPFPLLI